MWPILSFLTAFIALCSAQLSQGNLEKYPQAASLSHSFNPVQEAYWTGYPHHRRTPFALSPDGNTAYIAYLDASGTGVHIQQINPETFGAAGEAVTVTGGKEAGGLIAHNNGFALLTNEVLPDGTADSPADDVPVPVLYRYTNGKESWKIFLGGPGVDADFGLIASPDINGDLVFSAEAGYYAAYFVVMAYTGSASGHFGDAIRYITTDGTLETITGASSSWGCSHNTGIAFEAADEPPFASLCAEDQGAIWLNTKTQGMGNNGVKVSNEVTINGGSNEPMGGMSGSYSSLARFIGDASYIFTWVSRGAVDLTPNDWMGEGYTKSENRTNNRNVAIALMSDKSTLLGKQATSEVGSEDGDSQVNWITQGSADCSNTHVAAFNGNQALVSWEEAANPICDFQAMGCRGEFTGTLYQLVNAAGEKTGEAVRSKDTFVAGDMVTMANGRICWPYVDMEWQLDSPVASLPDATTSEISFACISLAGGNDEAGGDSEESSDPISSDAPVSTTADSIGTSANPSPTKPGKVPSEPEVTTPSSLKGLQASAEESVETVPETRERTASLEPSLTAKPPGTKCTKKTVWETVTAAVDRIRYL